ncbi:MAG TPA: flagellar hook-associated protein FlgK [Edaphobacter sp.]|nr:flagellar hook-associated protein FlgK [Edaphobacter sp.]
MGSINSMMDIARQALMADQGALNVTSNNVANQNTAGYTREVVNFAAMDAVTLSGGTFGAGVTSSAASQRDRVLEQRVQQQTQTQAQSAALESALQQVQNVFGVSSNMQSATSTALGTATNSFFNALSALASNPSDTATRQSVLAAATALASAFNSSSAQLSQVSSSLNQQVVSDVSQVNSLTSTIASLNGKISSLSPNADAGTLEDQRQLAITQLSQLVGLDQISTEDNGITLTTSSGAVLVSGSQSFAMSTTSLGGAEHILAGVDGTDVTSNLTGGDLGGVLMARDQQLPSYQSSLDTLAYAIGTQVNQQNTLGIDGNGNPGAALFSLPPTTSGAAALIQVATTDPNAIAAAAPGEGSAGNTNASALADLANAGIAGGQTPSSFLASFFGQVGSDVSSATSDNNAQLTTLTQLTTQRDSLSGVSLDEEAANLTQYQKAYQAAAEVFNIGNSVMASAINLGVETAVN